MAPALNLVDDRRESRRAEARELLEVLEQESPFPGARRIGITGAPGSGKSTLLDALVRTLRPRGETLAIVAVDPSSRASGGALLGDRIRVRSGATDPGVFLRSMAARDRLGGLADATRASVTVLAAAFDRVFVETVGVGQSEIDAASLADTLVYVATPGSGDLLQFMKAGVLETPDVFAVNKADTGRDAQRTASELASGLGLGEGAAPTAGWSPPVLCISARDGTGVEELVGRIDDHYRSLVDSGGLADRRRRGDEQWALGALERRYGSFGLGRVGGLDGAREKLRGEGPVSARLARVADEIERTFTKR